MIKFWANLKTAVVIIVALSIVIAAGTIIESMYDAQAAKKMVYDSFWMYSVMGALVLSLTAVMVDRWPWKRRHIPFIAAHIGIIILLLGSVITMKFGLDGQMVIPVGGKSSSVTVQETDLLLYSSFDGSQYTKLSEMSVDFFKNNPVSKPLAFKTDSAEIQILDYKPYVFPSRQVQQVAEVTAGSALRFQIKNANVSAVEWLVQRKKGDLASHQMGAASFHLGVIPENGRMKNEVFFDYNPKTQKINYALFGKDQLAPIKKGQLQEGDKFQTPWMEFEISILRFYPFARESWEVQIKDRPTPLTTAAVQVKWKDQLHWLLLNDTLKLFTNEAVYFLSYINRRIDMGYSVELERFEKIDYEGTARAKEYKSHVRIAGGNDTVISMNEPAKYDGVTFYQASFENDPGTGLPTASVLSVNRDPGRVLKYLGSLLISLGIILLFWFKKMKWR